MIEKELRKQLLSIETRAWTQRCWCEEGTPGYDRMSDIIEIVDSILENTDTDARSAVGNTNARSAVGDTEGSDPRYQGGFTDRNGRSVKCGDAVQYILNKQVGILVEALQDGDAYVTWDKTDKNGCVKWHMLVKVV